MTENTTAVQEPNLAGIEEKIGKLLRLAAKAGTPQEAEAATNKANELLVAYNLDMSTISTDEEKGPGAGRRTDEKHEGGWYDYEQWIWKAVADVNFCLYFLHQRHVKRDKPMYSRKTADGIWYRKVREFKIVGRKVNVAATVAMASYLLQSIERITRERVGPKAADMNSPLNTQMRSNWAVSFRSGAAEDITRRLQDRRKKLLSEEERKRRAATDAASAGYSSGSALTLTVYIDKETDANNDYLYGEGWSADQAQKRANRAAEQARAAAEYTAWAAANPEEARRKEAEREAEDKKRSSRYRGGGGGRRDNTDWSAFNAGGKAGKSVGLDPQADRGRTAGVLT